MSYYLDMADEIERRGEYRAADVIRDLYKSKLELEEYVKRISEARDILLKRIGEA